MCTDPYDSTDKLFKQLVREKRCTVGFFEREYTVAVDPTPLLSRQGVFARNNDIALAQVYTLDTVCVLRVPGGYIVGTTAQSPEDTEDRELAKFKAFRRALENAVKSKPIQYQQIAKTIKESLAEKIGQKYGTSFKHIGLKNETFDIDVDEFVKTCKNLVV
jgi:hypothetical protein